MNNYTGYIYDHLLHLFGVFIELLKTAQGDRYVCGKESFKNIDVYKTLLFRKNFLPFAQLSRILIL